MASRRTELDDSNVENEKLLSDPTLKVQSSLEKKIAESDLTGTKRVCTPTRQIWCSVLFVAVVVCGCVALIALHPGSGLATWWGTSGVTSGATQDVPTNPFARVPKEPTTYGGGAATGITGPEKNPINPVPETLDTKPAAATAQQPSQDEAAESPGAGAPGPGTEAEERLIPTKWTGRRLLGLPALLSWA